MLEGFQYSNIMRMTKTGMVTRKGKMKNTEKYQWKGWKRGEKP